MGSKRLKFSYLCYTSRSLGELLSVSHLSFLCKIRNMLSSSEISHTVGFLVRSLTPLSCALLLSVLLTRVDWIIYNILVSINKLIIKYNSKLGCLVDSRDPVRSSWDPLTEHVIEFLSKRDIDCLVMTQSCKLPRMCCYFAELSLKKRIKNFKSKIWTQTAKAKSERILAGSQEPWVQAQPFHELDNCCRLYCFHLSSAVRL